MIARVLTTVGSSKIMSGWFAAASLLALMISCVAGMYFGYEVASARAQKTISQIKDAQIQALEAKNELLIAEQKRGNEIAERFEDALKNIRIENRTFNNEVRVEREKLIYTDCVMPDSGVDLLNRHVDSVNLQFLGKVK